jgi:micrococcal nuclease
MPSFHVPNARCICAARTVIDLKSGFIPISVDRVGTGATKMGRRKKGTFPRPTVHRGSGRSRVRIGKREFYLGPAGSKEADAGYRAVMAAWGANGGTLPNDFQWPPVSDARPDTVPIIKPAPRLAGPTVADLLAATAQADFTGRVVGITDGDTVRVMRDGAAVKIRLHGIDAPESQQAFGSRSKQFLSAAIAGKTVTVVEHDTDRYGRIVGEIICDGANVNHASVDAGMAWWYRKYAPNDSALDAAEKRAKSARRGLWSDADPTPPWDYRRGGATRSSSGSTQTPAISPALPFASGGSHWLTGSSNKRHNSSCRYYRKTNGRPCGASDGTACKLCGG